MPQKVGTLSADLILNTRPSEQAFQRFQRQISTRTKNNNFMSSISADAKDFDNSLGKATNRVVAFGAAAAVFGSISKGAYEFAKSIVEIDNSLAKINVNLGQSQAGLKKFGADLFNIARQTGQTFEVTAKAAEELARQGLSAEETTKRLKDSLILSRIAGLDAAESVNTLTAAINSFNDEALTSTEIVNKFAAVDTKFAVSSKDLAEAVSRVGSTAQSAGVGIDQLIGLVTSLQQTTARGGATIGNGLKTIFTRIQAAPETVAALEGVGVAIKNTDGSLRDALSILRDYGQAREKVGEVERAALDRTVAGTFQINILKAALTDLNKEYSVYGNAVRTSAEATDEAVRKNEKLNETIASLLNSTGVSIKQLFASIGGEKIGPIIQTLLKGFERVRAFFSGDTGSDLGKSLGDGLLQGITNVLSGPALGAITLILFRAFGKVFSTIAQEARTLLSLNSAAEARATIQKQINTLLGQATAAEQAQYAAASSVLAKKEQILAIQARINQESLVGNPLTRSFQVGANFPSSLLPGATRVDPRLGRGGSYLGGIPGFAADPISAAINREVAAGAPAGQVYVDRDARVASFANPMGLLVANRRDEPLGGYQGVNRVLSQGGNPKTNGIPGFADPFVGGTGKGALRGVGGHTIAQADVDALNAFFASIRGLDRTRIREAAKSLDVLTENLSTASKRIVSARLASQYSSVARQEGRQFRGGVDKFGNRAQEPNLQRPFADLPQGQFPDDGGYASRFQLESEGKSQYSQPIGPKRYGRPLSTRELYYQRQTNARFDANYAGLSPQEAAAKGRANRAAQAAAESAALRDALQSNARQTIEKKLAIAEQKTRSRSNKTLGAAFLAPFIGGFAEPIAQSLGVKTGGGTLGGAITGGISTASQFAGFGALTGNPYIAGGAAALGALVGIFSKLTKSSEELGAELDDEAAKRNQEAEAISRVRALREQLKDAQDSGENPAIIRRLNDRLILDSGKVTSVKGQAVLNAAPGQAQDEAQRQYDAANDLKDAARNIADLLAGRAKGRLSSAFAGGFNKDILSSLTPDKLAALRQAGSGTFDVKEKKGKVFGEEVVTNQSEVDKANADYVQAVQDILPILTQFGIGIEDITKGNLKDLSQELVRGALQFRKTAQEADKQKTPANGLPRGSFLDRPNTDIYGQAAFLGRLPQAATTRNQRSRSQYDLFQELFRSGATKEEFLTDKSKDLFVKSKASVQNENLLDGILAFVQKALPGAEGIRTDRGEANAPGLRTALQGLSKRSGDTGQDAQVLLEQLDKGQSTLKNAGLTTPLISSGYNLPRGVKYSTYSGGDADARIKVNPFGVSNDYADRAAKREAADAYFKANTSVGIRGGFTVTNSAPQTAPTATTATTTPEAAKQVQINVNIDGALNLIANGMDPQLATIINTKVNQAVVDATSEYFKAVQPQLNALNAQLAAINGRPLPPTSSNSTNGLPVVAIPSSYTDD